MPPCELFNYKLIRNIFSCPRGGAFSAISCPSWWGICRFLRAIKTNPHLYPGVGWVGVYFDWCISITLGNKTYIPLYMSLKHFSFRPVNTSISLHFFSYLLKISLACRSAFSSIRSHSSLGGMLMQSVTATK